MPVAAASAEKPGVPHRSISRYICARNARSQACSRVGARESVSWIGLRFLNQSFLCTVAQCPRRMTAAAHGEIHPPPIVFIPLSIGGFRLPVTLWPGAVLLAPAAAAPIFGRGCANALSIRARRPYSGQRSGSAGSARSGDRATFNRANLMRNITIATLAACSVLAGLAPLAGAQAFSATREVIVIAADDLYIGDDAEGHLSGAGTLSIHSQKRSGQLSCRGDFTSSAALGGAGQLHCSDGTGRDIPVQAPDHVHRLWHRKFRPRRDEFRVRPELRRRRALSQSCRPARNLTHNGTELALADR